MRGWSRGGRFDPVTFNPQTEDEMGNTGWLIVAIVSGVLAVIGWVARERWLIRRRRRR